MGLGRSTISVNDRGMGTVAKSLDCSCSRCGIPNESVANHPR